MHTVNDIHVHKAPLYINTVYCKALYKSCTIVFACKYHHFEYLITECRNLGGSMLALLQMQPHAVQFALPMPTLNFGFSTCRETFYISSSQTLLPQMELRFHLFPARWGNNFRCKRLSLVHYKVQISLAPTFGTHRDTLSVASINSYRMIY